MKHIFLNILKMADQQPYYFLLNKRVTKYHWLFAKIQIFGKRYTHYKPHKIKKVHQSMTKTDLITEYIKDWFPWYVNEKNYNNGYFNAYLM